MSKDNPTTPDDFHENVVEVPLGVLENLTRNLSLTNEGDEWVIASPDPTLTFRLRNLVLERGQLWTDLDILNNGNLIDYAFRFGLSGLRSHKALSDLIHTILTDLVTLKNSDTDTNEKAVPADAQQMASRVKLLAREAWAESSNLLDLVRTPADDKPPAPAWLIHPVMADDGLSILFGKPDAGKSFVAISALLASVTGLKLAGFTPPVNPLGNVLYVDFEGGFRSFRDRLDRLALAAGLTTPDYEGVIHLDLRGKGNLKDLTTDIKRVIESYSVEAVVVDSATSATGDAIEASGARSVVESILSWNVPALLIAHTPKMVEQGSKPTVFGSQTWTALARLVIQATQLTNVSDDHLVLKLTPTKVNDLGRIEPQAIRYDFDGPRIHISTSDATPSIAPSLRARLVDLLTVTPNQTMQQLESVIGANRSNISTELNRGAAGDDPVFACSGKVGNANLWTLATHGMSVSEATS